MSKPEDFWIENGIITKYTGPGGKVVIPDWITGIGNYSFRFCSSISSVVFPESLLEIGIGAFECCYNLKKIKLPKNLRKIGSSAFSNCIALREVTFPCKIEFKKSVFHGCPKAYFNIPYNFPDSAVRDNSIKHYCQSIIKRKYSDSHAQEWLAYFRSQRKRLYDLALQDEVVLQYMIQNKLIAKEDIKDLIDRSSLTEKAALLEYNQSIPESKSCKKGQCLDLEFLASSNIAPAEAKKVWSYECLDSGCIRINGYKGSDSIINVPEQIGSQLVTELGDFIFSPEAPRLQQRARNLRRQITDIFISKGITIIGKHAFSSCDNLKKINIPDTVKHLGEGAFQNCINLDSIILPESISIIEENTFKNCSNLNKFDIPHTVAEIKKAAFQGCTGLKSITVPESIHLIAESTFRDCPSLTTVDLPDGIVEIAAYAFYKCTCLTDINLPDGLTVIGKSAFMYCGQLPKIKIPHSVYEISEHAFWGCTKCINIDSEISYVDTWVISADKKIQKAVLSQNTIGIAEKAFNKCTKLNEIDFSDSLMFIGTHAFADCSSLLKISHSNNITEIGDSAFFCCTSLKYFTIPDILKKMGRCAFYKCSNLNTITIPKGLAKISEYTFSSCTSLFNVAIPENIKEIEMDAFEECSCLTMHAPAGSYAETYAMESGIPFVAE